MERRILHIDMDAFFASVEEVYDPSLKGKALIIGGGKEDVRGVVSTASYAARQFGVHSAMPIVQARKLCPHGIFMRGNPERYTEAARRVRAILDTVTPMVQVASIDEAYLDITGSQKLFGGDDVIATHLKTAIRRTTGLPCTVGIGPNKLVAKVASEAGKPDGYLRVPPGGAQAFLAPMPIRKLPGAGPKTCEVLEALGILTIGRLAALSLHRLEQIFGSQTALSLQRAARGESSAEVAAGGLPKSVSRETTFDRDLLDWGHIERVLSYLVERCAYSLREQGLEAKRVTLKVRYGDFQTLSFAHTLPEATSIDAELLAAIRALLPKGRARRARVRLVGVGTSMLRHNQHQLQLFGGQRVEKWERVLERVDAIRGKWGFQCMHSGNAVRPAHDRRLR